MPSNVQRKRSLADERLDGLVPPVASPAHRLCRVVFARQHITSDDAASTRACLFHHAHMTLTVCARGVLSGCCCRPCVGESSLRDAARRCSRSCMLRCHRASQRKLYGSCSAAAHDVGYADLSRPHARLCVSWPSGLLRGHPGHLAVRKRRPLARHSYLPYRGRVWEQWG